ncbi:hypothetical protein [Microbacterium allomyrinae]|uniref:Uncharacterized protein n=1 Tax=Microbacterium allomyrinae TaxID=2830666 RepID=A0A9X1S3C4_9MICO|nr:hypothetical protein [Microbacterium allomyrinae]MCC2031845.1 hypothetical protein [Microbacterium allomyrinae]
MGTNKRYGDRLTELSLERQANGGRRPLVLPKEAHGPDRMLMQKPGIPVWAWVTWDDGTTERIATIAQSWNDRVVDVRVPGGWAIVWRSAVTHRSHAEN